MSEVSLHYKLFKLQVREMYPEMPEEEIKAWFKRFKEGSICAS